MESFFMLLNMSEQYIQFCHSLPHVESSEFIDRPRIEAPHLGRVKKNNLFIIFYLMVSDTKVVFSAPVRACFFSNSRNGLILKFWIPKERRDVCPKIRSPARVNLFS